MVSWLVLTAEPVEATPLPVAPIELVARFRAAWALAELAEADVAGRNDGSRHRIRRLRAANGGARRRDVTSFSVSGSCQYRGATSMIT